MQVVALDPGERDAYRALAREAARLAGRRDNLYKARIKILVKAEGQKFFDAVNEEFARILADDPAGHEQIIPQAELERVKASFVDPTGVKAEAGLLEYLFGEARLADAVHTDEKTGLHILPLSDRKHTPRDVFGSRAWRPDLDVLDALIAGGVEVPVRDDVRFGVDDWFGD